jgi:hypothetical protein
VKTGSVVSVLSPPPHALKSNTIAATVAAFMDVNFILFSLLWDCATIISKLNDSDITYLTFYKRKYAKMGIAEEKKEEFPLCFLFLSLIYTSPTVLDWSV